MKLKLSRHPWKHLPHEQDFWKNNCKLKFQSHIKYLGILKCCPGISI